MSSNNSFALFYGDRYYPDGGWGDFKGFFQSTDLAKNHLAQVIADGKTFDWYEIVHVETGLLVVRGFNEHACDTEKYEEEIRVEGDVKDIFSDVDGWFAVYSQNSFKTLKEYNTMSEAIQHAADYERLNPSQSCLIINRDMFAMGTGKGQFLWYPAKQKEAKDQHEQLSFVLR